MEFRTYQRDSVNNPAISNNGGRALCLTTSNSNYSRASHEGESLDQRAQPRCNIGQQLGHAGSQLSLSQRMNEARRSADFLTPSRVEFRTVIDYVPAVRNREHSQGWEQVGVTEIVRTREMVTTKLVSDSTNAYPFHQYHNHNLNDLFQNIASHHHRTLDLCRNSCCRHQNHDYLVHINPTCCHQNQGLVCNPASQAQDRNLNLLLQPSSHNQKHTLFHNTTRHHQTTLMNLNSQSNNIPGNQFGNMFSKTQNPSSSRGNGESSQFFLDFLIDNPKTGCQTQFNSLFQNFSNPSSSTGYDHRQNLRSEKRIQQHYKLSADDESCDIPPLDPNPIDIRIDGHSHLQKLISRSTTHRGQPIKVPFGKPVSSCDSSYSEDEDESTDDEDVQEITYDPRDGKTHSLPHLKNGPYTCPICKEVFATSQYFASHMGSAHYKYESFEERRKRHAVKYRRRNPYLKVVQTPYGLTILPEEYKVKSPAGMIDQRRRRNNGVRINENDGHHVRAEAEAEAEEHQVAGTGSNSGKNATRAAPNSESLYEVNVKMEF